MNEGRRSTDLDMERVKIGSTLAGIGAVCSLLVSVILVIVHMIAHRSGKKSNRRKAQIEVSF